MWVHRIKQPQGWGGPQVGLDAGTLVRFSQPYSLVLFLFPHLGEMPPANTATSEGRPSLPGGICRFLRIHQLGHMPISDLNTGVKGICPWPGLPLEVPWRQLERVPLSLGRRNPMSCEDTGLGGRNFSPLCRYHLSRCSQWSWICRLPGLGHGPTGSGCGAPPTQSS